MPKKPQYIERDGRHYKFTPGEGGSLIQIWPHTKREPFDMSMPKTRAKVILPPGADMTEKPYNPANYKSAKVIGPAAPAATARATVPGMKARPKPQVSDAVKEKRRAIMRTLAVGTTRG